MSLWLILQTLSALVPDRARRAHAHKPRGERAEVFDYPGVALKLYLRGRNESALAAAATVEKNLHVAEAVVGPAFKRSASDADV